MVLCPLIENQYFQSNLQTEFYTSLMAYADVCE